MTDGADGFSKDYSDQGFMAKGLNFAKVAGKEVIEKALQLYYAMQASGTPVWAKTVIVAALGYFISPVDAIPDIVPVVGYADDLGVLAAALAMVATYISPDVKAEAIAKMETWFGSE